jgi:hypothetical protein
MLTAPDPPPSKSHDPDATYDFPSGVISIFCTWFAIAARANRGSAFNNFPKSFNRSSTNLRVSLNWISIASVRAPLRQPTTLSSSLSNSTSFAIRNFDGCPSAIAFVQFSIPSSILAFLVASNFTSLLLAFSRSMRWATFVRASSKRFKV